MNIVDIIRRKRDKKELSKEEIEYFVYEYTKGNITDYQASALVMAIYLNGMNNREITDLTLAMANSGEILDLSTLSECIVDKHSTGGVGDKVSLILMPLVASLGIIVAKMSGRGLGFTGGTIDKLESIPGYNTGIKIEEFINNIKEIGISLIGQTMNLAPADKKIYALRDTIACTESIPLIASSIMSKKIAAGANKIVLDVTCGSGAFMKDKMQAESLSKMMKQIGKLANKETVCVITNMEEPLGFAVGNNLEVIEAINSLKGNMPNDVREVVLELGAYMYKLANPETNIEENKKLLWENIINGKAYKKFVELVEKQGGDISYLKDTNKFKKAEFVLPVILNKSGYIYQINAEEVGILSCNLGAGRKKKEDKIDESVGIILKNKVGDFINKGDIVAYIHANDMQKGKEAVQKLEQIYKVQDEKIEKPETILEVIL